MKPFSQDYVLRETLKHMQDSVNISTQKTLSRLPEFVADSAKIQEIMDTLSSLNALNKLIEEIKANNSEILEITNA